jgi:hypothetical protein
MELIASALVFLFAFTYKKYFLEAKEWIILVLAYVSFLIYQSYKVGMF